MSDAREIIANGLSNHGMTFPSPDAVAVHLLNHLSAAGYRILGPDEVDQLERIAKGDIPGVWQEKFEMAQEIVRALGRKA